MRESSNLNTVSDDVLLRRLSNLVRDSRRVEADLVEHIGEVDARKLYAREAMPSMFAYCTRILHLSEAEAWLRIPVARASREHEMLLPMLRDGRLHLSGIRRLAPHLTHTNRETLLRLATHKTRRQIEELVAEATPRPDAPALVRKLRLGGRNPGHRSTVNWVQTQLGRRCPRSRLREWRPGIWGSRMPPHVPDGDLATIIDLAVTEKLERLEARRFGKTAAPRKSLAQTSARPTSRHVPAAVRRAVYARDKGRCAFVDERGTRCGARDRLEFHHHHQPFGRGGGHSATNIRLMCRVHNQLQAERDFGTEKMARYRRQRRPGARFRRQRSAMVGNGEGVPGRLAGPP